MARTKIALELSKFSKELVDAAKAETDGLVRSATTLIDALARVGAGMEKAGIDLAKDADSIAAVIDPVLAFKNITKPGSIKSQRNKYRTLLVGHRDVGTAKSLVEGAVKKAGFGRLNYELVLSAVRHIAKQRADGNKPATVTSFMAHAKMDAQGQRDRAEAEAKAAKKREAAKADPVGAMATAVAEKFADGEAWDVETVAAAVAAVKAIKPVEKVDDVNKAPDGAASSIDDFLNTATPEQLVAMIRKMAA